MSWRGLAGCQPLVDGVQHAISCQRYLAELAIAGLGVPS